jgi:two-component system chemotaxis response regulator CheB
MKPVRVLIIDDSAAMRGLIANALSQDPGIAIVGEAADPLEARQAIKAIDPDVVTLDIEMPNMNGLDFLEKIMRLRPTPVIMVSSLTRRGAEATVRALEIGAFDCVGKPSIDSPNSFDALPGLVKMAARTRGQLGPGCARGAGAPRQSPTAAGAGGSDAPIVAIGASTGGVEALMSILSRFPGNCPPTVITQHMPALFTRSFAARLNGVCPAEVSEATDGAKLAPGRVYVAPGGSAHLEVTGSKALACRLRSGDPVQGHRPSIDVLFRSVARAVGRGAVGVILTGMGRDGADGLLDIRRAGGRTLGQSEASCVVYGMPKAALEIGAVEAQLSLADIPNALFGATCWQKSNPKVP